MTTNTFGTLNTFGEPRHKPTLMRFTINDDDAPNGYAFPPVDGWSVGEVANSWAVPYFSPEQMMALIIVLNNPEYGMLAEGQHAYLREDEAYVIPWRHFAEQGFGVEVVIPQDRTDRPDRYWSPAWPTTVYQPGGGDFCWIEIDRADHDFDAGQRLWEKTSETGGRFTVTTDEQTRPRP